MKSHHKEFLIIFIGVALIASLVFFGIRFYVAVEAASYTFTQTNWAGGVSITTAVHPTNQTGWTYYSSSTSIQVPAGQLNMATTSPGGSWWNSGWINRKKITFSGATTTANLADFPIAVLLNSSRIDYSKTQNSGQDIRFVDPNDTTALNYEIEKWDETA